MTQVSPHSAKATTDSSESKITSSWPLRASLWFSQILLAAVYLPAGMMKLFSPVSSVASQIPWAAEVPEWFLRSIGFIDIAAALGILLPTLLRLYPRLAPTAAAGSVLLQICAMIFHSYRGEWMVVPMNLCILGLSWWVYIGRLKKAPVVSR
jgi:hypothetical protein